MAENLAIPELFKKAVSEFPDKIALQIKRDDHWQRLTYRDLEEYALKVATFLVREGFKKGDTAGLVLENRPQWPVIYLGIVSIGMICVPIDPQLNPEEIKNLLTDSSAKVLFCSQDIFIKKIKHDIYDGAIKTVVLDIPDSGQENVVDFSTIRDMLADRNALPQILPQEIASLIYTSGTTGTPKGVLLSHGNICSNFKSIAKLNICYPSDNVLSILPLYHTYAFMVTLIAPLFLGMTITYCLSFKPQDLNQIIKEANITILVGVPQLFFMLHKAISERLKKIPPLFLPLALLFMRIKVRRQWGNLRLLISGGARLDAKISRDLYRLLGIKIIEGYGLTETSPVVTFNPPRKIKPGSAGKVVPDVRIKIHNPDKSGIGQVLIQGPNVMQGYFKHPEWTQGVIKEGWFYSGDLGYLDSEGYLFLVGREKEVIVLSSGKNIYPEELEECYGRSPYIKEICILAYEEEKFGRPVESLHAIVVANLEYFRKTNETNIRPKIRWELENIGKGLTDYKHIMGFTITKEELPRTALKKIKRYQVKQKYLEEVARAALPQTISWEEGLGDLNKDLAQKVIHYICGQLRKPVYIDSHLEIDLGIDSLTRVELGLGLESVLKVKLPDELIYNSSTVKELILNLSDFMDKAHPATHGHEELQRSWSQILSEVPKQEILKKIRIEPRFLDKLLTWIFQNILLSTFRVFWFLRIKGRNNLPAPGPYIICSNHASYLDGFVIFSSLKVNQALNLFFLGYSAILEQTLIQWTVKLARLISIDPNLHLTEAMEATSFILAQKKIVCIFPEGRRSVDENVGEFKKGIGILVKELRVPVVPVYIQGSHYSWPRTSRLPRLYPLKIIFGCPIRAEELLKKTKEESTVDDYEFIAQKLRQEVVKLAC